MAPRFVARQLASPKGFGGRLIMAIMNRGNAGMNRFALETLAPGKSDRVLEIGFGGGVLLPELITRSGKVTGLDRSREAIAAAQARFGRRAEFLLGSVEQMPFADASFDKVVSCNTVYFWTSLHAGMREIARVLAPGGRLVIGFLPKERMDRLNMPADIFTSRAPEDVRAAMAAAGMRDARIEKPLQSTPWSVATALRA